MNVTRKASLLTVCLAVGLAIFTGCKQKEYFMPAPKTLTPEAQFVKDMQKKTGGDVTKLTPEERKKMDTITRGFTEMAIKPPKPAN